MVMNKACNNLKVLQLKGEQLYDSEGSVGKKFRMNKRGFVKPLKKINLRLQQPYSSKINL